MPLSYIIASLKKKAVLWRQPLSSIMSKISDYILYYCPILVNNIATESGLARKAEWLVFS